MKLISGFTIIRNGLKFDFPFLESIESILPICDEFVINIGESEDETKSSLLKWHAALSDANKAKIVFFDSHWPFEQLEKRRGGMILAEQTNLALDRCTGEWCFYLQADEVVHERDLPRIHETCQEYANEPRIDALVFEYLHFYGGYNIIQRSRSAYRREMRIIRNKAGIRSIGDAQSFRYESGEKIPALLTPFQIFHYGWARPQEVMKQKTFFMDKLYHGSNFSDDATASGTNYQYKNFIGLRSFEGTHPTIMRERLAQSKPFNLKRARWTFELKDIWKILSGWIEQFTGWRPFEYKNYKETRRIRL